MVDAIVFSTIILAAVFTAIWLISPNVRAWVERPKYRFQSNVQSYDKAQAVNAAEERTISE
jgi:hypothetical protein